MTHTSACRVRRCSSTTPACKSAHRAPVGGHRSLTSVGMTLDIAHLHIAAHDMGFDYLDAVAEAAPWVVHLHANDSCIPPRHRLRRRT
ncbi:MAG: hypothetical protein R2856_37680 [Caldilineaceae bacterium]